MTGRRLPRGFTLTDTAVSIVVTAVLILAVSTFLANNQGAFNSAYAGAFSPMADGAMTARTVFQKTVRRASSTAGTASVDPEGRWIEVQYHSDSEAPAPDRVARFELSGQDLVLQKRVLDTAQIVSLETVCGNVTTVEFNLVGDAAQMFLTLGDGTSTQVVNACATRRSP